MRVAIVSPEFPPDIGGVETYAWEFVKEMASRGHEVTVFTLPRPKEVEAFPNVRIEPVLKLCRSADRKTFASFRADAWHALNAAYAWIGGDQPETVVSVYGNDFLRPYYPIAQPDLRQIPVAWHWSNEVSRGLRPLWISLTAGIVQRSLPRVRHIIACSCYTERALLERIPACRGRTSVGYVGVGADFFGVAWQTTADGVPRLLTVCRLSEPRKNVDRVLHALAKLKERHRFRYTVVGDGHRRPSLEALTRSLGLEDRVHFTGFVTRRELLDAYAHSDLMVLTSSVTPRSHEGFGIVYLEAAASGVPSLAARLAGAAEAVEDGTSGMFVNEPTIENLAEALGRFLRGEIRFDRQACRNFAGRFTWTRVVDHALQYYLPPH
jgi:glycosyltransferase involved in cell wall biosynthesis